MTLVEKYYAQFREGALRWARSSFGPTGEKMMLYVFFLPDLCRLMLNLLAEHASPVIILKIKRLIIAATVKSRWPGTILWAPKYHLDF